MPTGLVEEYRVKKILACVCKNKTIQCLSVYVRCFFKFTNNPQPPMRRSTQMKSERCILGNVVFTTLLYRQNPQGKVFHKLQVPPFPELSHACAERSLRQMFCFHAIFVSRRKSRGIGPRLFAQSKIIGVFMQIIDSPSTVLLCLNVYYFLADVLRERSTQDLNKTKQSSRVPQRSEQDCRQQEAWAVSVCFSRIVHFNFLGFKNKNGLRSHSETDSGFRSSYEPDVSEEEEMCTHVPVHLQRISAEIPAHGAVALRRSVFSPHHRSVSSQTHPVYM